MQTFDKSNLFFLNDSTGFFLAAYGIIFKTTDGGMNWINISTTCGGTIVEEDIFFPDQNMGYFGGWYASCAARTTDGGNSWQAVPNNLMYIIKSIYFPSASTGYMAGWINTLSGGVQKTIDSGNTWVVQNTPSWTYNSIYCPDINICYAVGSTGVISKTTDGGLNWQQQSSGTLKALRKIFCTDGNTCYAVGDSGVVLKTTTGGVGINEQTAKESEVKIFPNPAVNELTIQNNSSQVIQFTIYNSLGEKIIDESLTNKTSTINFSAFSNSIYLYKVISDSKLFNTGKIIKR